jgi:hypothetical protein
VDGFSRLRSPLGRTVRLDLISYIVYVRHIGVSGRCHLPVDRHQAGKYLLERRECCWIAAQRKSRNLQDGLDFIQDGRATVLVALIPVRGAQVDRQIDRQTDGFALV